MDPSRQLLPLLNSCRFNIDPTQLCWVGLASKPAPVDSQSNQSMPINSTSFYRPKSNSNSSPNWTRDVTEPPPRST